ncbi:MAG: ATP-binding cassette domain-containing protein [Paenibacillaceae bacterium]
MDRASVAISIDNLSVAYAGTDLKRWALQEVSLDILNGSWTSIVGANGSGKSTLAKVIAGLCEPTEGSMMKAEDARVHIVLQNPETQILGDTVFEEINLSLRDFDQTKDRRHTVRSILDEAGLTLLLDTPTNQLSGGEKQLLNIAACVAAGATLFVLDEVTSMLDNASRDQVIQVMQKLNARGATILWCTHRSEELGLAERVILLEKGHVSYDGTTRNFLYGDPYTVTSPCEQWGMELPYVVQVVKQLEKRGYSLRVLPLLPQELSEAIKERCL